jgi:hypothetical protein
MSKKVLIAGTAVAVVLAGAVAIYCWVDYRQAENCLTNSRLKVHSLSEAIERHPEDVARLKDTYGLAKIQVDILEALYSHSLWIDREEISALRTELEKDKQDLDRLVGAPSK